MSENKNPICWGQIAMLREIGEENEKQTDKLLDAIRLVEDTAHKQYEIVKELQAMKLVPYLEQRLRLIEAEQQRRDS